MKKLLTASFVLATVFAFSQEVIDVDKTGQIPLNSFYTVSGSPVVNTRFVRLVEGTPYFSNRWMNAVALSANGERYRSPQVKLDLYSSELHYMNDKEQEFVCTIPLKEVILTDTVSGNTYHFVHSTTLNFSSVKKGWYQQLVKGKVPLYQYSAKVLSENKPYGSPVSEQKITTTEEFFVGYNGTLHSVKKPKDIPAVLSDKKAELETYLQTDPMKRGNNAEKMSALLTHYNSLL